MNQRVLGIITMMCAPFLFLDFVLNQITNEQLGTLLVFDLIYMTGWMCGIVGLAMNKVNGRGIFWKLILTIQMLLLTLAQISNLLILFNPDVVSVWSALSDTLWTVSNIFMIVIGLVAIKEKVLLGYKKFIPLAMGLWLPLTGLFINVFDSDIVMIAFAGPYSAIVWALFGLAIYSPHQKVVVTKMDYTARVLEMMRILVEKNVFKFYFKKII